jgi:hypothetical protein
MNSVQTRKAYGSGFVHENTTGYDIYLRALVAKIKAADPAVKVRCVFVDRRVRGQTGAPDDTISSYAFAPLKALACV